MDFALSSDVRVKLKESENCASKNKLWNIKVTVKPVVTGEHGTIPKCFVKGLEDLELRGQVETIQTTALIRSTEKSSEDLRRRRH